MPFLVRFRVFLAPPSSWGMRSWRRIVRDLISVIIARFLAVGASARGRRLLELVRRRTQFFLYLTYVVSEFRCRGEKG
jgi:hypothetical protein